MSRLALNLDDFLALLGSLLRARLLSQGKTRFLFSLDEFWPAGFPQDQGSAMDEQDRLGLARDVTTLLGLENPEALCGLDTPHEWAVRLEQGWADSPQILTFMTSGSTGEPVACRQGAELMEQEVREALAALFPDVQGIRALVPRHHIYGFLFTVLLPKALGVPVRECSPAPTASLVQDFAPGDLVVAFPLFWKGLASLGQSIAPGVRGVTSTGPCAPQIITDLLGLGLSRMTEVYGSSETGGLGARHDIAAPYDLFPFWVPVHRENGDPEQVVRVLPGGDDSNPYPVPDVVRWEGERAFRPTGRRDKAVQVAGVNVHPEAIARTIEEHPLVQACAVRLMRPEEGTRLKAFVVTGHEAAPGEDQQRELRAWMSRRLSAPQTPRTLSFGPTLPRNAMGKLCDW